MEMKSRPERKESGFSLVEVLVALMIGSVGLLALAGILANVMTSNRFATDLSIATALARQKVEEIKLTDYNHVQSQTEHNLDENGRVVTGGKFVRITTVTANLAAYNTKTVEVAVYFGSTVEDATKKAVIGTIIYP